jgi:hypothetical protein
MSNLVASLRLSLLIVAGTLAMLSTSFRLSALGHGALGHGALGHGLGAASRMTRAPIKTVLSHNKHGKSHGGHGGHRFPYKIDIVGPHIHIPEDWKVRIDR